MKLTHEGENNDYIHSECTKSRMGKDDADEARLLDSLKGLSLFGENGDILKHIVTKIWSHQKYKNHCLMLKLLARNK